MFQLVSAVVSPRGRRTLAIGVVAVAAAIAVCAQVPFRGGMPGAGGVISLGDFRFAYDEQGISLLSNPQDPFGATLTTAVPSGRGSRAGAAVLGLTVAYRAGTSGEWSTVTR